MAQLKRAAPISRPRQSLGGTGRGGATNVARRGGIRAGPSRPSTGAQRSLQS
jgi:hypothetical protein